LQKKRLIFDDNIVGRYRHKFKKENAREISFDTSKYRRSQFKELFEKLLLGIMSRSNYTDSWYIEYHVKGENEPRYQILSPLDEGKLEEYIVIYFNNESDVLDGSYFFFDAIPADIESIKVIDHTKYLGLKAYDENNHEIDIRIDNRGVIRNSHQLSEEIVTNKVAARQQHDNLEVQIAELETKRQILENYINQIIPQQ
jgi:hypothetical protein